MQILYQRCAGIDVHKDQITVAARLPGADLSLALEGRFDAHHALMCTLHLEHIAGLNEMIARLDAQVEQMMTPFARQRDLLVTIPGIGPGVASVVISEIGAEVAEYFTTDAHLASWAGLCPGNHESAGKRKHGHHRLVLRFGGYRNKAAKKKAIVAIAHTLILIIWHVLTEGDPYTDLGADFYTRRIDPQHETRRLIARLAELGHKITVDPAA